MAASIPEIGQHAARTSHTWHTAHFFTSVGGLVVVAGCFYCANPIENI